MQRDKTYDFIKGLGIIMVVLGHAYSFENVITVLINSFHMPLFFVITGILYKKKSEICTFKFDIRKKIRKLIIPYIVFESIWCSFMTLLNYKGDMFYTFIECAKKMISLKGNTAIWYLPCLFFSEIIFFVLSKKKKYYIISLALMLIGVIFSKREYFWIKPFFRVLIGQGFITIGFRFHDIIEKKIDFFKLLFLIIIFIVLGNKNGSVALYSLKMNNKFLFIINSIIGTYILIQLACRIYPKIMNNKITKTVNYYGENSVIVVAFHMFLIEIIRILDYKLFGSALYKCGIWEGIILTIIVMIVMLIIISVCKKYFLFLFGKSKMVC